MMYGLIGIWNLRVQKSFKFKVVQIKFLAMHITNKKICFDIFMVLFDIFMVEMYKISSWNMILIS